MARGSASDVGGRQGAPRGAGLGAGPAAGPAVSVIVPAHNDEKYIAECLDSVLAQTFTDWECVCVDDGSADGSFAVFEGYARRDPRVRALRQENQGLPGARNTGIAAARGEYIFPLDSDDVMAPACLGVLYGFITTHDYAIVCPGFRYFGEAGGAGGRPADCRDLPRPTRWNMYRLTAGILASAMFPRELWEKCGGYDHRFRDGLEDADFWLSLLDDGHRAVRLPGRLLHYRQKPPEESKSRQQRAPGVRRRLRADLRRRHPRIGLYRWLHRAMVFPRSLLRFFVRLEAGPAGRAVRVLRVFRFPVRGGGRT